MPDAELCKLAGGGEKVGVHFLHVSAHAIADLIHQFVHFIVWPFHDQLNATIREVADVSADVVAEGDVLDCVAEADALDMTGKVAGFAMGDLRRGHRGSYRKPVVRKSLKSFQCQLDCHCSLNRSKAMIRTYAWYALSRSDRDMPK